MDDRTYFELEDEPLSGQQTEFLAALRMRLGDRLRPYVVEWSEDELTVVLDVDAPEVALANVGLKLTRSDLIGDRISVHDRSFPPSPTADGFRVTGTPAAMAEHGAALLKRYADRPVVRHEWLHRGRVYADCYLFQDTGERLAQMYRSDWAPRGQEARLKAAGFERGKGWIQTEGLGEPDRVVHVRGQHPTQPG
ncbi:MAG: hypothetical protein ACK5MT_20480 [Actinomycetales bacterium]